jgi:ComF family protein
MDEPVRNMIHALKYGGWTAVAGPLAQRMAALPFPEDVREEVRIVVPVPTSAVRLRERGYNQAALLAEALARRMSRTHEPDVLVRQRSMGTQTTLHPDERRANVAGAFTPAAGVSLAGEHVLLIDDVWTTGATALACVDALLSAGARVVSVATFARAIPGLDRPSP